MNSAGKEIGHSGERTYLFSYGFLPSASGKILSRSLEPAYTRDQKLADLWEISFGYVFGIRYIVNVQLVHHIALSGAKPHVTKVDIFDFYLVFSFQCKCMGLSVSGVGA